MSCPYSAHRHFDLQVRATENPPWSSKHHHHHHEHLSGEAKRARREHCPLLARPTDRSIALGRTSLREAAARRWPAGVRKSLFIYRHRQAGRARCDASYGGERTGRHREMIFADFEIWALGPGIGPIHRPVITKSAILGITAAAAAH